MAQIYKSGAFLQQCFSVHPLSLTVKMLTLPDKLGIYCAHCQSRHRLTIGPITRLLGDSDSYEKNAAMSLESCVAQHQEALHVIEVSVDRDIAQFRCRLCKMGFEITVSLYETYQP